MLVENRNKYSLVLIGSGILQKSIRNELYGKSAVIEYVHDFTRWFNKIYWATIMRREEIIYTSKLDCKKIIPLEVGGRSQTIVSDYLRLNRILNRNAIVLLYLPNPWLLLTVLLNRFRIRGLIVYVANDYSEYAEYARKARGYIYTKLYLLAYFLSIRSANGVIVRGRKNYHRVIKINKNIIETVSIGLKDVGQLEKSAVDKKRINLLYIGKVERKKGVHLLLDAFVELGRRLPAKSLKLGIVGNGPDLDELKKEYEKHVLNREVIFYGYVDERNELASKYLWSDIVVVPSIEPEGVPRVIEEAMFFERPVVATRVGGIPGEFNDGEIMFAEPNSASDLAQSIYTLITDQEMCNALIEAAKVRKDILRKQKKPSEQHAEFIISTLKLASARLPMIRK